VDKTTKNGLTILTIIFSLSVLLQIVNFALTAGTRPIKDEQKIVGTWAAEYFRDGVATGTRTIAFTADGKFLEILDAAGYYEATDFFLSNNRILLRRFDQTGVDILEYLLSPDGNMLVIDGLYFIRQQ